MAKRFRLVVFTSGPLATVNRIFFERMARDPALDLVGIVVDEYQRPRRPLPVRIARALREDGWTWVRFKAGSAVQRLADRVITRAWERFHPVVASDESYEVFEQRTGVPVHRVADIHSDASLALIRGLEPGLGVIVGTRILRDTVLAIPDLGTVNIHKRKVPEYRGGGPVGYWEVLAGERSIGVTIHWAVAQVDAGDVLGQIEIPIEECDTLASLRIKADIAGANLYHRVIRDIAAEKHAAIRQDMTNARTFRAPTDAKVWRLEQKLRRRATARMPALRVQPSWLTRARLVAQYVVVLPRLRATSRRLVQAGTAPISMLFYHVVANRVVNHLCIPLEQFARHADFLRRYVGIVSLHEAVERLRSGKNDRYAAAITFDDGYRDNHWLIAYLKYFEIPATFFVSAGHVDDGTPFAHDHEAGFAAAPMRREDVRALSASGFTVGSHALYHEDFASAEPAAMDRILRESREAITAMTGRVPHHFSFPFGERERQVTSRTLALALRHYPFVYSAYGGYNLPDVDARHFVRLAAPVDVLTLALVCDGYPGFRQCLRGQAWDAGARTLAIAPPEVPSTVAARADAA